MVEPIVTLVTGLAAAVVDCAPNATELSVPATAPAPSATDRLPDARVCVVAS